MLKDLLTGRLALVTGAGRGNGAAIARGLAEAGAKVIVTDVDTEAAHAVAESITKSGGEARGHALDVTDHESCRKLAEDIALLVGPIRILVNNAGIYLRGNMLAPDGRDRWAKTMAVNVGGVFNVTKGAIAQFTRALAVELAPDAVRVNAVAPGIIATAMTEVTRNDPKRLEAFLSHVPLKRVGQPEELVGPVLFLCSDWASYVTGAILAVDGGFLAV